MNIRELTYGESLELDDRVYIDVRAPVEFAIDHIPGSVNLPIFDDNERREIGTLYRQAGKETAIVRGTEIGSGKISTLIGSIIALKKKNPVFLCARGGMRSASVASLTASFGIDCCRIIHGYKGYRAWVAAALEAVPEALPPLVILQGLTGAGKTRVLKKISTAIDLEGMAGHRSSLFGAIGLAPVSQKRFESRLLQALTSLKGASWILVEGESRKIGNLHIPDRFFSLMRGSRAIYLDTPVEKRVEIIIDEYGDSAAESLVLPIIEELKKKMGRERGGRLRDLFVSGDLHSFVRLLLETHYDPLYSHTIKGIDYLFTVEYTSDTEAAEYITGSLDKLF